MTGVALSPLSPRCRVSRETPGIGLHVALPAIGNLEPTRNDVIGKMHPNKYDDRINYKRKYTKRGLWRIHLDDKV